MDDETLLLAALEQVVIIARARGASARADLEPSFAQLARMLYAQIAPEGRVMSPLIASRMRERLARAVNAVRVLYVENAETLVSGVVASALDVHVAAHARVASRVLGFDPRRELLLRVASVATETERLLRLSRARPESIADIVSRNARAAFRAGNALIERGLEARRFDADVARDLAASIAGLEIDTSEYGLSRPDVTPLRGLVHAGGMLFVSEAFNAMRAVQAATLDALGLVRVATWTLSERHAELASSPDVCDDMAVADVGYGPGRYLLSRWPRAPHPHCGCYPSAPLSLTPVESWARSL